ncbi:MAG: hypothetical protein FWH04_05550 [Oscillospiraceae bacterium]|nr:hypothetical protein [Oscillospiraceae bacterium]
MKYYEMFADSENADNYMRCLGHNTYNVDDYATSSGEIITGWNIEITFICDNSDERLHRDYLTSDFGWYIVSKRFRGVVEDLARDSIQYLPIKLIRSDINQIDDTYMVANVIDIVDAFDLKKSKHKTIRAYGEKIHMVEDYALREKSLEGHHIFKLKGETIPTFVSEKFKDTLQQNNIMGFAFLEVKLV